jgi:hypothetical protein
MVSKVLKRDLWRCQTFNNLKTLFLGGWCVGTDLHALVYFLRRSPALEKLTVWIHQARIYFFLITLDFFLVLNKRVLHVFNSCQVGASGLPLKMDNLESKATNISFNCEHLKKVKIRCPRGDKRAQNIVNVILANAISPPEIVIDQHTPWE